MVLMPVLLKILYPLSPALRLYEFVRWLLGQVLSWLEMLEDEDTSTLIQLDAFLSIIEQFLHAIVGKLAAERLGLTFRKKPSMGLMPRPQPGKLLTFYQVFGRFERLLMMFQDIDRLVARRVRQIRREIEANPLGLADLAGLADSAACRHFGRAAANPESPPPTAAFSASPPSAAIRIRAPP